MAYSNDEMMGSPSNPADHSAYNKPDATVHMAGDVIDVKGAFENIQQSNALTRDINRNSAADNIKAKVIPISPTAKRNNPGL